MTLVDTSAWIEFLRATNSPVHLGLRERLQAGDPLATTEPIVMELLAGARDQAHLARLRALILGCTLLPVAGLVDYEDAASIYRSCRRSGTTIRRLVDCLIAMVSVRADVPLLHADADFDRIAAQTQLRIAPHRRP